MASPGNQHCANCIGTLLFSMHHCLNCFKIASLSLCLSLSCMHPIGVGVRSIGLRRNLLQLGRLRCHFRVSYKILDLVSIVRGVCAI